MDYPFPPPIEIESPEILRKCIRARSYLAELKGLVVSMPNESLLINTLVLQEARESSAIENIITTQDELYQSSFASKIYSSPEAKEVHAYAVALKYGFEQVRRDGLIRQKHILEIQEKVVGNSAGIRKVPGTVLKNDRTGEVVYTPPQEPQEIQRLLSELEIFVNDNSAYPADELVKMALLHHQFESIHPFYDGNGRVGRIINILYLIRTGLLDLPVLYLSRAIVHRKQDYYSLLQNVRSSNGSLESWQKWTLFFLDAVETTAKETVQTVFGIRKAMSLHKDSIRKNLPKLYSQDLLNHLFRHPYTKIGYLQETLQISRPTAIKYLDQLVGIGVLSKRRVGRNNYYSNDLLVEILRSE